MKIKEQLCGISQHQDEKFKMSDFFLYFLAQFDNSNVVFLDVSSVDINDNFLTLFANNTQGHEQ